MSLHDGVWQLLERMETASVQAAANEALDHELQTLLRELQAQRQSLECVQNVQAVQRHAEEERGEPMACMDEGFASLVGELVAVQARMRESMECLLGPCDGVEYDGGLWEEEAEEMEAEEERVNDPTRRASGAVSIGDSEDGDGDIHASIVDGQSLSIAPAPADEGRSATVAPLELHEGVAFHQTPSPRIEIQATEVRQPLLNDGGDAAAGSASDAVNHRSKESEAAPMRMPAIAPAYSPPDTSLSGVAICPVPHSEGENTAIVLHLTFSGLEICRQLFQRDAVTVAELGELINRVQTLIPFVDVCVRPAYVLKLLQEAINLIIPMVVRTKLNRSERVRLVDPLRSVLVASGHTVLSTLAASMDTAVLGPIFPQGFMCQPPLPRCLAKAWTALTDSERCDRDRVRDQAVVKTSLRYLERNLGIFCMELQQRFIRSHLHGRGPHALEELPHTIMKGHYGSGNYFARHDPKRHTSTQLRSQKPASPAKTA